MSLPLQYLQIYILLIVLENETVKETNICSQKFEPCSCTVATFSPASAAFSFSSPFDRLFCHLQYLHQHRHHHHHHQMLMLPPPSHHLLINCFCIWLLSLPSSSSSYYRQHLHHHHYHTPPQHHFCAVSSSPPLGC